jgi:zinc/manganese transport system substrate-binding protein
VVLSAVALPLVFAACSASAPGAARARGKLRIVAAENVWGSLAAQVGGDRVSVTSIVDSPNADPHDYEPTAADARAVADAALVVQNGIGYDAWMQRLLDANPVGGRATLTVGVLVGVPNGGNPHQWYAPSSVRTVIDAIASAYEKLDASSRAYFESQRNRLLDVTLKPYFDLIARIKSVYAGTPVGASESLFQPLANALGLDLLTPPGFLKAISEGTDPTAADKAAIDTQIRTHAIKVYLYNSQNATPDVQRQVDAARAEGIGVTTMTETLVPASASFEQWQVTQLHALADALAKATGK